MHLFAHFFSRVFLHILVLILSSSFCLAAENDDARRKDATRPSKTRAANTDAGGRLPLPANLQNAAQSVPGSAPRRSKATATYRSVRRIMRTRRLLLAALRVWELKNGYGQY